jgi:hypothetical protein
MDFVNMFETAKPVVIAFVKAAARSFLHTSAAIDSAAR